MGLRYVGIAAYSGDPPAHLVKASEEFINALCRYCNVDEVVLVIGGYWGLMKVIVDYALRYGLKIIVIPPLEMEGVNYPEEVLVIRSGTSFRLRSVILVRTCDVLVSLGGAGGTIQEIMTAYDEGKPVFILNNTGLPTDNIKVLTPYVDHRKSAKILFIDSADELARVVCRELGFAIS